jgi:hypothetical protein
LGGADGTEDALFSFTRSLCSERQKCGDHSHRQIWVRHFENAGSRESVFPIGFSAEFRKTFKGPVPVTAKAAIAITSTDTPTKVFEGEGCLTLREVGKLTFFSRCGYVIREGKTLEIPISLLRLTLDTKVIETDLPPRPQLSFVPQNFSTGSRKDFGDARVWASGLTFLLPSGQYDVKFTEVEALAGEGHTIDVGDATDQTFDITPRDLRSEIIVKAEAPKYNAPVRRYTPINEVFLVGRDSSTIPAKTEAWNPLGELRGSVGTVAFGAASKPWEKRFRIFGYPAKSKLRHEVVVNNFVVPLSMVGGAPTTVELTPIDVGHIDGTLPGYFTVHQIEASGERLFKWREGQMRYLTSSEVPDPRDDENSANGYIPTGRSVFVPKGFQYKVRSFAFDEVGDFRPQSEHDVDLR